MSQAGQEVVFLCLISISFVISRWFVTYRKGQEVVFLCLRHVDLLWGVERACLPLLWRGLEVVFPCLSERTPTLFWNLCAWRDF